VTLTTQTNQVPTLEILDLLNQLEEFLIDGTRIPLTGKLMLNEGETLELLDDIRMSIPDAFNEAQSVLERKAQMLAEAQQYAEQLVGQAEQQRAALLSESSIAQQAQQEAAQMLMKVQQDCEAQRQQALAEIEQIRREGMQIQHQIQQETQSLKQQALSDVERIRREGQQQLQQIQQECEQLRQQTYNEVDQLRRDTQQQLQDLQQRTVAECEGQRKGADQYAEQILSDLETRTLEIMRIVRNGRQQLQLPENSPQRVANSGRRRR
jgi:cell division septum initiation protein DivIVA